MRALSCILFLLAVLLTQNSLAEDPKSQDQHHNNQDEGKSTDEAAERIRRQLGGYFGAGIGIYGGRQFGNPYYPGAYGGGPYFGHPYGPYFHDRRFGGGGFGGGGFYGR